MSDVTAHIAEQFVELRWRTSRWSLQGGGECVEVAEMAAGQLAVRDSKCPGGGVLVLSTGMRKRWLAHLTARTRV